MGFGNFLKAMMGKPHDIHCRKCDELLKNCEYEYQFKKQYPIHDRDTCVQLVFAIRAVCPKCGTVEKFDKIIKVRPGENPDYKIREWCRSTFGH